MKTKRLLAWLLVLIMCFTLVSCQNDKPEDNSSETASVEQSNESTEQSDESAEQSNESTEQSDESAEQSTESTEQSTESAESSDVSTDGSQSSTSTPLLYRVTDKNGNTAWLFGSIHVGREDFYPLPDYVLDAFNNADSLAVEFDIVAFEKDMSLQINAMAQMVYKDGSTIKNYIPQELYDKAVAILEENDLYMPVMDMYCPSFWGDLIEDLMIEELECNYGLGVDLHLINKAYEAEKEVIDIESAEFQFGMMANFENDIQIMLLKSAVESYENFDEEKDEAAAELKKMMDLWASGNESEFAECINTTDDTMTDEEKQLYEKYDKIMVADRNLNMTEFAEEALTNGQEVFICVGAAHIVGDGALADLLSERGYTVELITE